MTGACAPAGRSSGGSARLALVPETRRATTP
jgi:hypothetical protein